MTRLTAIERAFEIAKSGKASTVSDIRRQIKNEGYGSMALEGRSLGAQLAALINEARAAAKTLPSEKLNTGNDK